MPGYYELWNVFGSFLIACVAGFGAFESVGHTRTSTRPGLWTLVGGVSLGLGIWSMHFIGMLAWHPPFPLFYGVRHTAASVLIAIAASWLALKLVALSSSRPSAVLNASGALLVGAGICAMHYTGIFALHFSRPPLWNPFWVTGSFLVAVLASWSLMELLGRSRGAVETLRRQIVASVAIALAICGMHYAGLRAMTLSAGTVSLRTAWSFSGPVVARIGVGSALLVTLGLLVVSYRDKALWAKKAREARFQAEESARKLEGMAVAGKIAASVAHEINNPLEAVMNLIYLAQSGNVGEPEQEYLRAAQDELKRIAAITAHTLRFHRQQSGPAATSIPELFESALVLFRTALTANAISVQRHWPEDTPMIVCRQGEIRQVVANIVSNAIDAMPAGGTLRLSVQPDDTGLTVEVADTGHGIPIELRDKILEPFFTTKGMSGTGLGLSISAEIITRHGGTLTFSSPGAEPTCGTSFRFSLPFDAPPGKREVRTRPEPQTVSV